MARGKNFKETDWYRVQNLRASQKQDFLKEPDTKILAAFNEDSVNKKTDTSSDFSLEILEIIFKTDSVLILELRVLNLSNLITYQYA